MLGYKYMSLTETHSQYNYNPSVTIKDENNVTINSYGYGGYAPSPWKPFTRYDLSNITTEGYLYFTMSDGGNFVGNLSWSLLFEKT